jgi:hypothetical protein
MYAFSEKGYVTNALFALIMAEFRKVIAERHPDMEHLLYMDRLGAHLQPDVVRSCLAQKLYTVWFPSHTSEFLQPADAEEFAAFHQVLNSVRKDYNPSAVLRERPAHAVAMDLVGKALDAATNPNVVKKSFRSTGIEPWNPDLILSHAKIFTSKNLIDGDRSSPSDQIAVSRVLAATVLKEHHVLPQAGRRRARVWNNKLYLPEEVVDEAARREEEVARARRDKAERAHARQAEKERKAAEKEEKKRKRQEELVQQAAAKRRREELAAERAAAHSCKACARRCRDPNNSQWRWCEYCEVFGVCPYRRLCPDGLVVLEEHEEEERQAGKRPLHAAPAHNRGSADT